MLQVRTDTLSPRENL